MNITPLTKSASFGNEDFWGEITPCEHLVQFYQDDSAFLDSLEGFVAGGLMAGDAVIIIATPVHLMSLEVRLTRRGINLAEATATDQYMAFEAENTLARFMRNGWPDETLFHKLVTTLLSRAKTGGRRVRAFGEMVAILWAQGNNGATVQLEHLWHQLCNDEIFSLFCAYPKSGFTQDAAVSVKEICDAHSRMVPAILAAAGS